MTNKYFTYTIHKWKKRSLNPGHGVWLAILALSTDLRLVNLELKSDQGLSL